MVSRSLLCLMVVSIPIATLAEGATTWEASEVRVASVESVSSSMATVSPTDGELIELSAIVTSSSEGPSTIPIDDVLLIGASSDPESSYRWELAPIAAGAMGDGACMYEIVEHLAKGAVGFGAPGGGGPVIWVKREKEGGPAVLELVNQTTHLCAAFLVPGGGVDNVTLKISGKSFETNWKQ